MTRVHPGDTVIVHGGVYRDPVLIDGAKDAVSGEPGAPITIAAAAGEEPRFFFSRSFSRPDQWERFGEKLWATAAGSIDAYDVGTIWHDDDAANKMASLVEIENPWDFWFDAEAGRVVVFAESNPATLAKQIEIPAGSRFQHAVQFRNVSYITLDGLTIKYPNAHGIQINRCDHITIRNCSISHGGGALIWDDGTRYGNGVELYGEGHYITVENCRISWFWDTGITNQGHEGDQSHIVFRNNHISYTKCGLEHWATGPANVRDVTYEGNVITDTGVNWARNMQNVWGGVRLMREHPNGVGADTPNTGVIERFVVRDNTFLRCGSTTGGQTDQPVTFDEHPSIRLSGGPYIVRNNLFRDGRSVGIYASHGFHGEIVGNTIELNAGEAIVLRDVSEKATVTDNVVRP